MKLQAVGVCWLVIGLGMQFSKELGIACAIVCVLAMALIRAPKMARELREIWSPRAERERRRLEHERDCRVWGVTPPN